MYFQKSVNTVFISVISIMISYSRSIFVLSGKNCNITGQIFDETVGVCAFPDCNYLCALYDTVDKPLQVPTIGDCKISCFEIYVKLAKEECGEGKIYDLAGSCENCEKCHFGENATQFTSKECEYFCNVSFVDWGNTAIPANGTIWVKVFYSILLFFCVCGIAFGMWFVCVTKFAYKMKHVKTTRSAIFYKSWEYSSAKYETTTTKAVSCESGIEGDVDAIRKEKLPIEEATFLLDNGESISGQSYRRGLSEVSSKSSMFSSREATVNTDINADVHNVVIVPGSEKDVNVGLPDKHSDRINSNVNVQTVDEYVIIANLDSKSPCNVKPPGLNQSDKSIPASSIAKRCDDVDSHFNIAIDKRSDQPSQFHCDIDETEPKGVGSETSGACNTPFSHDYSGDSMKLKTLPITNGPMSSHSIDTLSKSSIDPMHEQRTEIAAHELADSRNDNDPLGQPQSYVTQATDHSEYNFVSGLPIAEDIGNQFHAQEDNHNYSNLQGAVGPQPAYQAHSPSFLSSGMGTLNLPGDETGVTRSEANANEINTLPQNLSLISDIQERFQRICRNNWVRNVVSNGRFIRVRFDQFNEDFVKQRIKEQTGLDERHFECIYDPSDSPFNSRNER